MNKKIYLFGLLIALLGFTANYVSNDRLLHFIANPFSHSAPYFTQQTTCGDEGLICSTGQTCKFDDATESYSCEGEAVICGDNKVNGQYGEICDPIGSQNPNGNGSTCADDCKSWVCATTTCQEGYSGYCNPRSGDYICEKIPDCSDDTIDSGERCSPAGSQNPNGNGSTCNSTCSARECSTDCMCPEGEIGGGCNPRTGVCNACIKVLQCEEDCTAICKPGEISGGCNTNTGQCYPCYKPANCGDGVPDPGEQCDAGEDNSRDNGAACTPQCRYPSCGDGYVNQESEACDTGYQNSNSGNASCRTNCTLPICGDNICDNLTENSTSCPNDCKECNNNTICEAHEDFQNCPNDCDQDLCNVEEFSCDDRCGGRDTTPMDIFLVLDNSSSMSVTSPGNPAGQDRRFIMKKAAKNIIRFLQEGDRVAIIEFNSTATTKQSLTAYLGFDKINEIIRPDNSMGLTNYEAAYTNLTTEITNNINSFADRKQLVFFISDGEATIGGFGCSNDDRPCQITRSSSVANTFKNTYPDINIVALGIDPTSPDMEKVLREDITRFTRDYYQANSSDGASCDSIDTNVNSIISASRTLLCSYACISRCGDGIKEDEEGCDDGSHCSNGDICDTNSDCNGIEDGLCIPRSGDGCSSTCEPEQQITNAVCSSNYNNKEIYRTGIAGVGLTGTTVGLCTTGTPTQFSYDAAKAEWTWTCESTGSPASCKAKEIRCGDTVTQSGNGEQCDDGANSNVGDGCNAQCKTTTNAVCSSNYNNKEIYRTGIAGVGLTGTTVGLCTTGTPTQFSYDAAKAEWTWTCESTGSPASCKAKEIRCGDTVTQSGNGEQCDDGANSNVGDGCNAQCKTTTNAVCSSNYNNKEIYRTGIAGVGLTGTTVGLCTTGTPTQFSYDAAKAEWTWTCESTGSPASCKAKEIRCGDTVTQSGNGEQCDGPGGLNQGETCTELCIKKTPSYGGSVPTNPKEPESPKKEQPRIPPVLKKLIERPAVELEPFIEQLPVVLPKTGTILYYGLIGILLSSILTIVLYYYKKEE